MLAYAIGNFGFVRWEGPPPQLVQQHVRVFTKIGQPGISGQLTGAHGNPFDVELWSAYPNKLLSQFDERDYRLLVGSAPQFVTHAFQNYWLAFSHLYLVLAVQTTSVRAHPLLVGATYNYPGGYLLKSRWTLIPIAT